MCLLPKMFAQSDKYSLLSLFAKIKDGIFVFGRCAHVCKASKQAKKKISKIKT